MNYTEKLDEWFQAAKARGEVVDIKFFPGVDPDGSIEKMSRAVYETLTGVRETTDLDISDL